MPVKSVQQIMLGTVCRNEKTTLDTLSRIKAAGFDAIELNAFMTHKSSLPVRLLTKAAGMPVGASGKLDWKGMLLSSGLEVSAYHTDLGTLESEMESVIEEALDYRTDRVVITGMYRFNYSIRDEVQKLSLRLDRAGERLRKAGIRLFYHNHNVELVRTEKDECAYDIIINETDPDNLNFEFDSYWFASSGASPLYWMERLGKRMKLWHIADCGTRLKKTPLTPIVKADSVELGTGNMPLLELRNQAFENKVECVVLESHRNWIENDPVRSLELSSLWLNEHL